VIKIIIITFITVITVSQAFAAEDIGQSRLHPVHPFYFLKTVREYFELKFAGTPRIKIIRQLEFSQRRLREVNALMEKSRQDLIEPTMERYWFHLDTVLSYRPREEALTLQIIPVLETHLKVLEKIYYQVQNARAKISLRSKINKILENSDTPLSPEVRMHGCNFLLKEATSSGLNSTEQAVILERAKRCQKILNPRS